MKKYIVVFVLLIQILQLSAQKDIARLQAIEDTLATMAYAVFNDTVPEHRFIACKELIVGLKNALKVEGSFEYKFPRLESLSFQYPQDSSFRVITWQLYVDKDDYRYYGAIQMNTPELTLFPLIDRSYQIENPEYSQLTNDNWYGAIYYKLKEVKYPQGKYYLLFGFDGFEFFKKRKVLDVLSFKGGKPVFGLPVFVSEADSRPKQRIVLEYSATASVRLNYDEIVDMITYDHLIPMEGSHGEGVVNLPDGSYEGYAFEKGYWHHVSKIFNDVQEEAPRPFPILDEREKNVDLFGNKKNKN